MELLTEMIIESKMKELPENKRKIIREVKTRVERSKGKCMDKVERKK